LAPLRWAPAFPAEVCCGPGAEMKNRTHVVVVLVLLAAALGQAQVRAPVTVSAERWTVAVDSDQATLSLSREGLGTVLTEVRLNFRSGRGLRRLQNWSVEGKGERGLSIRTSQPPSAWFLELAPQTVRISSTSADGVLTAKAPAPPGRMVARLLDLQGTPVKWMMTEEVKSGYGGDEASAPSFLPGTNPDVMYFALGQVASSKFHSLFDRKTDSAIAFSEETFLQRGLREPESLETTIPVPGNTTIRVIPDYYTKELGVPYYVPFDDTAFPKPPVVWASWDNYYAEVTEQDIVRNTDWIADHLKSYGLNYVRLDDSEDRGKDGEHYWIEKWNAKTFPHGGKWLADYIKAKGLHPGMWIVPNAYAGAAEARPEWYLHDKNGKLVLDYSTPALDSTNPEVHEFLRKLFTTLDDWGFEYYMFDGEHALPKYVPGVDLDRLYDKSVDPLVAYRDRLKLIRETIGPQRFIEGCPAGTPLNGIGYFDAYFTGEDMYPSWQGQYNLFSSINANAFLNHIVVYVMPGEGIEVGPPMSVEEAQRKRVPSVVGTARTREDPVKGFGTTLPEARTLASYVSLTGVVYTISSVMPELPEDRVKVLKMTLPPLPIYPVDLFSRGVEMPMYELFRHTTPDDYIHNYPEILDLKVNAPAGIYDVAALTNWRSWPTTRSLDFAGKLGLNPELSYVVFDFWGQKLLGTFKGKMDVAIDPHDTRVLLIHPLAKHPQLVGTSRHISGAYSIDDLAWDSAKNSIRGTSESVPGDDYTLWFYVPAGVNVAGVRVQTKAQPAVAAQHELAGNVLKVTFKGQAAPAEWEISFNSGASK